MSNFVKKVNEFVSALKTELKLPELTEENDIFLHKFFEGTSADYLICSHAGKTYEVSRHKNSSEIKIKRTTP